VAAKSPRAGELLKPTHGSRWCFTYIADCKFLSVSTPGTFPIVEGKNGRPRQCHQKRLLLDSRVVDVTMSYNPIFASCILLEVIIFQGPYK
jgi:hypothetical protein